MLTVIQPDNRTIKSNGNSFIFTLCTRDYFLGSAKTSAKHLLASAGFLLVAFRLLHFWLMSQLPLRYSRFRRAYLLLGHDGAKALLSFGGGFRALSFCQTEPHVTLNVVWLAISRTPDPGKLLDERRPQSVAWVHSKEEAVKILSHRPSDDLILVPLGPMFLALSRGLRELEAREKRT